ncbi:Homeobox protein Nkx-2.4-like protein [Aphelenchoides besseyi]|nr:Homeobox protein Nkx-2.4-like protein [Aphelenchoides besseyi]KAI6198725.1 Homeobox protein Nkx-2.4-like protein [Aphelenchoides besseyi]
MPSGQHVAKQIRRQLPLLDLPERLRNSGDSIKNFRSQQETFENLKHWNANLQRAPKFTIVNWLCNRFNWSCTLLVELIPHVRYGNSNWAHNHFAAEHFTDPPFHTGGADSQLKWPIDLTAQLRRSFGIPKLSSCEFQVLTRMHQNGNPFYYDPTVPVDLNGNFNGTSNYTGAFNQFDFQCGPPISFNRDLSVYNTNTWPTSYPITSPSTPATSTYPDPQPLIPSTSLPSLPRLTASEPQQRKPKKARILFSSEQVQAMEAAFQQNDRFAATTVRSKLAQEIKLTPQQVKIWFQNRRYKEKQREREQRTSQRTRPTPRNSPPQPPIQPQPTVCNQWPTTYFNPPAPNYFPTEFPPFTYFANSYRPLE